jgi:hypothetical protein
LQPLDSQDLVQGYATQRLLTWPHEAHRHCSVLEKPESRHSTSHHIMTHTFTFRVREILSCEPEVTLLEVLAAEPLPALRSFDHYPGQLLRLIKLCHKSTLHSIQ